MLPATPILLTNISPGLVVKNYKELCRLTNQPVLFGDSKTAQLKQFERYFRYTRQGHKYIIETVHQEQLPKVRKMSQSTLEQYVSLMYDLCEEIPSDAKPEDVFVVSRNQKQLHLLLGICNEAYYENKAFIAHVTPSRSKQQYSESIFSELPREHVVDFYKEVDERGRRFINQLVDRFVEKMHKKYYVTAKKTYNVITANGYGLCSDNQHTYIREAIGRTLNLEKYQVDKGYGKEAADEQDIFLRGRTQEFYEDVLQDARIVAEGITAIYSTWSFSFTKYLIEQLDRYAEHNGICQATCKNSLSQKAVKYHDLRTQRKAAEIHLTGTSSQLTDEYINDWLTTHYYPSREVLKTLVQFRPTGEHK